jgi:hydroxypyruvate isomerase
LPIGLNRRDLHDRLEEEIKANIENARRLKIPNLICFSRNRSYCLGCSGVSSRQFAACEVSNDIYHMQIMEGDIIRTIRSIKNYIGIFNPP